MLRKYQNEAPADNDEFSGKGHQQVANAIAHILIGDASQHIIGIEGSLGAGKSTVIKILSNELADRGFHLVTFDADQYHTALKPALIQTIERELESMLKGERYHIAKLTTAVETALGKRLTYTKETSSHIPLPAISFLFLLGVSALQVRPFLTFLYDRLKDTPTLSTLDGVISGGLLAVPFLLFLGMKCFGSHLQLGDLLKRNSRDTINETIDINRDVGAIELRQAFKVFANLIPKGKTIVLVIDNIDRVSPDIARELWSDIDTLISLGSKRFRILLPYSERHLAKALEQSAVEANQSGKEFISKRIPIPFSAPPIASTGWRERFDRYWNETLPDIDGKEGVKELIDIWQRNITPRYLKSLVNRIGTRMDSCPEDNSTLNGTSCAAYLMAVRDEHFRLAQLVGDTTNLNEEALRKINTTHKVLRKYVGKAELWSKHIAAIHYQTSFSIAQSELIIEPLRAAFTAMDAKEILSLSSLHGFDVFFKKQIAITDAFDLVKIMAALVELPGGQQLVEQYLIDFNHELKDSHQVLEEFDDSLVTSFLTVIECGIKIDLHIPKREQQKKEKAVQLMARSLLRLNNLTDTSTSDYEWEELEEAVKQTYGYFSVTKKCPSFIETPSAEMVVNVLYPIRKELDVWSIDKLALSLPMESVVIAACRRQNLLSESETIFPLLHEAMRSGDLHSVEPAQLLKDIPIANSDIEVVLTQLPFSTGWHQSNNMVLTQQLTLLLHKTSRQNPVDQMITARLVALTCATLFSQFEPSQTAALPNVQGQNQNVKVSGWITPYISQHAEVSNYLPSYLSFVSFERLLKWCENSTISGVIFDAIAELIRHKRVRRMQAENILISHYSQLKHNLPDTSSHELLSWLAVWPFTSPSPERWQDECIDDILGNPNGKVAKLQRILIDFFDDPDLTDVDWLERLSKIEPVDIKVAQYLTDNGKILSHPSELITALINTLSDRREFKVGWLRTLFNLLDTEQQNGLCADIRVMFFKSTTSTEDKYRCITYFGDRFSMPRLRDGDMADEAIAFLKDAITKNKHDTIVWLTNQPFDESGWNLNAWSEAHLRRLEGYLSELDESPLSLAVDTLSSKEDNTDDVA